MLRSLWVTSPTQAVEWTETAIAQWVADFVGVGEFTRQPVAHPPLNLRPLVGFSAGDRTNPRLAYVFRLNRQATGQAAAPSSWFCALFELSPGSHVRAPRPAHVARQAGERREIRRKCGGGAVGPERSHGRAEDNRSRQGFIARTVLTSASRSATCGSYGLYAAASGTSRYSVSQR